MVLAGTSASRVATYHHLTLTVLGATREDQAELGGVREVVVLRKVKVHWVHRESGRGTGFVVIVRLVAGPRRLREEGLGRLTEDPPGWIPQVPTGDRRNHRRFHISRWGRDKHS
jgi:hypothetical protein